VPAFSLSLFPSPRLFLSLSLSVFWDRALTLPGDRCGDGTGWHRLVLISGEPCATALSSQRSRRHLHVRRISSTTSCSLDTTLDRSRRSRSPSDPRDACPRVYSRRHVHEIGSSLISSLIPRFRDRCGSQRDRRQDRGDIVDASEFS